MGVDWLAVDCEDYSGRRQGDEGQKGNGDPWSQGEAGGLEQVMAQDDRGCIWYITDYTQGGYIYSLVQLYQTRDP